MEKTEEQRRGVGEEGREEGRRGGGEEERTRSGKEERRRGGEEKRRGVCPWAVEWLCFLGPAVGDSSTVRSK